MDLERLRIIGFDVHFCADDYVVFLCSGQQQQQPFPLISYTSHHVGVLPRNPRFFRSLKLSPVEQRDDARLEIMGDEVVY